jgi:hypothetical protein
MFGDFSARIAEFFEHKLILRVVGVFGRCVIAAFAHRAFKVY